MPLNSVVSTNAFPGGDLANFCHKTYLLIRLIAIIMSDATRFLYSSISMGSEANSDTPVIINNKG